MDGLVDAVPWVLPVILVILSLKVIGSLGERVQRGLERMREEGRRDEEEQTRATSSERLQAGDDLPPIEPR